MRSAPWLCTVLLMVMTALSSAGDIQVTCPPGLHVYLDGELVGRSSTESGGLLVADIDQGTHTIRVEKHGFEPQVFEVKVPIEVVVAELVPVTDGEPVPAEAAAPAPEEAAETSPPPAAVTVATPATKEPAVKWPGAVGGPDQGRSTSDDSETAAAATGHPVGTLQITSIPQECDVEVDGTSHIKTTAHLSIGNLAVGEHRISFHKEGYESISGVVGIRPGDEISIQGNLEAGRVEFVHEGKGSLRVLSEPTSCKVKFQGTTRDKGYGPLNISKISAGEYPLVVSIRGRTLSTKVIISRGMRTVVRVSFMKNDKPFVISHEPL